jgi:hypothetical protein
MADTPNKSGFNKAANTPAKSAPQKDYSHDDVIRQTNGMKAAARTGEQRKTIDDIQKDYEAVRARKDQSRMKRNVNFHMGLMKGLHPNKNYDDLLRDDKTHDQRDQNQAMNKAKDYYHRNYSLRKTYRKTLRKDALKGKAKEAMNKARDNDQDMDMTE